MRNLAKIALRNLFRYRRRTLLTSMLIVIGVMLVVVTSGFVGGFRYSVTSILTDTMLSHVQVHKKGYTKIINASPLNLYLDGKEMEHLREALDNNADVEAYSPRINFMAMASIYTETTTMKLTAVDPERESRTCPALPDRLTEVKDTERFLKPGEIIIPGLIATAFHLSIGDSVVLVCTNRHGSMNGAVFTVAGILEGFAAGEFLRNGYIHISDAEALLQMDEPEISEVAIRLRDIDRLKSVYGALLSGGPGGRALDGAVYEVDTWESLSPFTSILMLVSIVTYVVKFVLIAIVLISVLNIMMMAVYERTKEIGTISAMGTPARRIRRLFLLEGVTLGAMSLVVGLAVGGLVLVILDAAAIHFKAGPFTLQLITRLTPADIASVSVMVILVSILASLQPAHKASRLDPVDALGHV
jgi:putative ABC transport system permease protein